MVHEIDLTTNSPVNTEMLHSDEFRNTVEDGPERVVYEDFKFDVVYKHPANTAGVYSKYYFGKIDGIELGAACGSESECRSGLDNLLTCSQPYTLEDYLREQAEYLHEQIEKSDRLDYPDDWRQAAKGWFAEHQNTLKLLNKVLTYKKALELVHA